MSNSLEKVLELIKKTGDNCIVLDHEGNPSYVVVKFSDYQKMVLGKMENSEELGPFDSVESDVKNDSEGKKSLNEAKKIEEVNSPDENYYFEPVD